MNILLLAAVITELVVALHYTDDEVEQKKMWEVYKQEFHKSYANHAEEQMRFKLFLENIKEADEHQTVATSSTHGITMFSDQNITALVNMKVPKFSGENAPDSANKRELSDCSTSVQSWNTVDWTSTYTTPIKNSGTSCLGSGWAFTVTSQIESDVLRQYGSSYNYVLSPEQLLQCVTNSNGCDGGTTEHAFTYLKVNGLELNNNYPYTSYNGVTGGPCAHNPDNGIVKVAGYFTSLSGNEACMAHYVQNTGPLSVCLTVSNAWFSYTGGIMSSYNCPSGTPNHCVQAVGVKPSSLYGYWKMRTNYGTGYGEGGFVRLSYGHNTCGLTYDPIYTSTIVDY